MRDSLFHVERMEAVTLQSQIREKLVSAILSGQLVPGKPIPSTRAMAKRLKVSRNTVMIAYQELEADGYLEARERSGFFVSETLSLPGQALAAPQSSARSGEQPAAPDDGTSRLLSHPSRQRNIEKPRNWHQYPYPFVYGQIDAALFPITAWRDCTRQAMSRKWVDEWTHDRFNEDDPMLIEQIRQRILTRRGIMAGADEILVTLGAQNALFLLTQLLVDQNTVAAIEDPGYPDVRNIFQFRTEQVQPVPVDDKGLDVDQLSGAGLVYTTPSHQFPTNATMSLERRRALLSWANTTNALIIEDDYEFETNYSDSPNPSLKSLDRNGRVLYVGSLSKSLMPGLRLGFLVAPPGIIAEARALRRMILRHPPGNNQRIAALFLALGHHDALINRLQKTYAERSNSLHAALEEHLPGWARPIGFGGSSVWLRGPIELNSGKVAELALDEGVVVEPGNIYFADPDKGKCHMRLGFSSIPNERIRPGIERLASVIRGLGY